MSHNIGTLSVTLMSPVEYDSCVVEIESNDTLVAKIIEDQSGRLMIQVASLEGPSACVEYPLSDFMRILQAGAELME